MLRRFSTSTAKTWLKFSVTNHDGVSTFHIMDLPKNLVNEYVEFQMKYFVSREFTHRAAGLDYNVNALNEYRDFLRQTCATPPYHSIVCCPEVEGRILPKIVGTSTIKLIKKDDEYGFHYPVKTPEMKRLFKIFCNLNKLYPLSDVMTKYDVEKVFEYESITVNPDYAKCGIASKMGSLGIELCRTYNVPMLVAWTTSEGSKKASEYNGFVEEFKISRDEVMERLNIKSETASATYPFFHVIVKFSDLKV